MGETLSLILKHGLVYDGLGNPPRIQDIGITSKGRIALGSALKPSTATPTLELKGLVVCPGFIDTHGHSEFTLLAAPEAEGKLTQGVTTEVAGNCGMSGGPLFGAALVQREQDLHDYGIKERWNTLKEYLDLLDSRRPAINIATLAGHGNIRASVMGYENRPPTRQELSALQAMMAECVSHGALGLSTGLIYPPGIYSESAEIAEIARAGREAAADMQRPFIYATHMRSETDRLLEAIEETLEIGRAAGCRTHISHIKTANQENWYKIDRAIELMEAARAEGMHVSADRYPYIASSTDLDAVLPAFMYEGGNAEELKRLRDPAMRARLFEAMPGGEDPKWSTVRISSVRTDKYRPVEGRTVSEAALAAGLHPVDYIIEVLVHEELGVGAIFHGMCEENLVRLLGLPYCMVGSDSSVRSRAGITRKGKPHPRGFGSFPRYLARYAEREPDTGLPTASALRKVTGLAAETFGLTDRGVLRQGAWADITVFDPRVVQDAATFESPYELARGIVHVFVAGGHALKDGVMTGVRTGRTIRA